jgi:hypothetical protein
VTTIIITFGQFVAVPESGRFELPIPCIFQDPVTIFS